MMYKKIVLHIIVPAIMLTLITTGCDSGSFSGGSASLDTSADSASYAFGYLNGKQLKEQGMGDLNPDALAEGMRKAFSEDSSEISEADLRAVLQTYQIKAQQKSQEMMAEVGEKNKEIGEKFLAENRDKPGVKTTDSGLQYKVLEEGDGANPSATDTVTVNYKGTLINGEVFDSSYKRGEPADIPLNRVIAGWTEGIQLMKEGAKYKFWIPGELAYGPNPRPGGPIGPNETLIFEVELIKVK